MIVKLKSWKSRENRERTIFGQKIGKTDSQIRKLGTTEDYKENQDSLPVMTTVYTPSLSHYELGANAQPQHKGKSMIKVFCTGLISYNRPGEVKLDMTMIQKSIAITNLAQVLEQILDQNVLNPSAHSAKTSYYTIYHKINGE